MLKQYKKHETLKNKTKNKDTNNQQQQHKSWFFKSKSSKQHENKTVGLATDDTGDDDRPSTVKFPNTRFLTEILQPEQVPQLEKIKYLLKPNGCLGNDNECLSGHCRHKNKENSSQERRNHMQSPFYRSKSDDFVTYVLMMDDILKIIKLLIGKNIVDLHTNRNHNQEPPNATEFDDSEPEKSESDSYRKHERKYVDSEYSGSVSDSSRSEPSYNSITSYSGNVEDEIKHDGNDGYVEKKIELRHGVDLTSISKKWLLFQLLHLNFDRTFLFLQNIYDALLQMHENYIQLKSYKNRNRKKGNKNRDGRSHSYDGTFANKISKTGTDEAKQKQKQKQMQIEKEKQKQKEKKDKNNYILYLRVNILLNECNSNEYVQMIQQLEDIQAICDKFIDFTRWSFSDTDNLEIKFVATLNVNDVILTNIGNIGNIDNNNVGQRRNETTKQVSSIETKTKKKKSRSKRVKRKIGKMLHITKSDKSKQKKEKNKEKVERKEKGNTNINIDMSVSTSNDNYQNIGEQCSNWFPKMIKNETANEYKHIINDISWFGETCLSNKYFKSFT